MSGPADAAVPADHPQRLAAPPETLAEDPPVTNPMTHRRRLLEEAGGPPRPTPAARGAR